MSGDTGDVIRAKLIDESPEVGFDLHKGSWQLMLAARRDEGEAIIFAEVHHLTGNDGHTVFAGYPVPASQSDWPGPCRVSVMAVNRFSVGLFMP